MADPAEFAPHELDRIEDSLESLEFAPAHDDAAPMVRRRLDDYRSILALSREVLPMVEVPRGLLDGVLAQARAAAEAPAVAPTPALAPERPSFWTRLRKAALIPGVALAGTAALVLVMVQGERASESVATAPAPSRAAEAQPASAPLPTAAESQQGVRFQATQEASKDSAAPRAGVAGSAAVEPAVAPPAPVTTAPGGALERKGEAPREELADEFSGKQQDAPAKEAEAEDAQQAKPADGDPPRWDIARGDRARHRGDCESARSEYSLALGDADARVQARAHAGMGLCDAVAGDRKSADAAYKLARDLDGEIVGFIDTERPKAPASSSKAKAKPAPKPPSKNAKVDDALE